MNEINRRQIAFLHLKFKVENAYTMESMSSHGVMSMEDVTSKVLKDIYPTDEVASAVMECARSGTLDLYYDLSCEGCKTSMLIREDDCQDITTLARIVKHGAVCDNCGHNTHQKSDAVNVKVAVPLRYLGQDREDIEEKTLFERLLGWLKLKKM